MKSLRVLILTVALLFVAGQHVAAQDDHDHGAEQEHPDEEQGEHGVVRLSPEELSEFEIHVAAAGPATIETHISLPGEVRPNADKLAHIVPRFSGIVIEVHANLGDHVKKSEALATIESDESLTPFQLTTLISGTVIGKHITLGEAVSRDRDSFVIADLSQVWIDLTVYQRDLHRIETGQTAHVYIGHSFADSGVVSYVTPIVDEKTRTATARVVLSNKKGHWRPGMFVTGKVVLDQAQVPVAVPLTALHTVNEKTVVFVETEEGFQPQDVTLGRSDNTRVEVLAGLVAGQRYVTKGGFTLKAELGKESFGDGHGH